ncbi:MAG: hypothetical protein ACXAAT_17910, partial [Candidatus Hodarchaeales archaeon]
KTWSIDLPTTVNAIQTGYGGGEDAYFAIIKAPVTQIPQTTTTPTTTTPETSPFWTPLIVFLSITALVIFQKRKNHY